eukprot:432046-Amphidinium_carterae.1
MREAFGGKEAPPQGRMGFVLRFLWCRGSDESPYGVQCSFQMVWSTALFESCLKFAGVLATTTNLCQE